MLQKIKPTTPSKRQLIKLNLKHLNLSKKPFLKQKLKGKKNTSGKNNLGQITVYHKGGGVKKRYRKIQSLKTFNFTGIVCSLEYDPNRNALIAAIFNFINFDFFYTLAAKNLKVGDIIRAGFDIQPTLGSSLPMFKIPVGSHIFNLSTKFRGSSKISKSAGTFSVLKKKSKKYALIELTSGKQKFVLLNCFASIGEVSKELHFLTQLGKAGKSRWLNKRPTVRGVSMNPIDHPNGGGEGRKSGNRLSPWGKSKFKKKKK